MWALVERYTGKVGYRRGVKSEGLLADPPVVDCSGWSRLLLTSAMEGENKTVDRLVFEPESISAIQCWSDRIVQEIEIRTGRVIHGEQVTAANLPRCAAIGIKQGAPSGQRTTPDHAVSLTSFRSCGALQTMRRSFPSRSDGARHTAYA